MQEVRAKILAENPDYFSAYDNEAGIEHGGHLQKRWVRLYSCPLSCFVFLRDND